MKVIVSSIFVLGLMVLSGCVADNEFADLEAQMAEIRKRPKGHIEPPPEFKAYKSFNYGAAGLRSPFTPPVAVETVVLAKGRHDIKPDFNRQKEILENYSIDSLLMVGTIKRPGGSLYALIKDPDGGLHRVEAGNYMGRNHGRILHVAENKIDVVEIVSDGQDGWLERPRTIVLKGLE